MNAKEFAEKLFDLSCEDERNATISELVNYAEKLETSLNKCIDLLNGKTVRVTTDPSGWRGIVCSDGSGGS